MSSSVCVIGNLNLDVVLYPLPDLPLWGTEAIADALDWRPGGIANALLCLAHLGVGVSAVAMVGQDPVGAELLALLRDAGVGTDTIELAPDARTAISVCLGRQDGERAFVTHLGHLERLDLAAILRQGAAWEDAHYVLISGTFLLPGLGHHGTGALIEELHKTGHVVLFDPGWDPRGWPHDSLSQVRRLLEKIDVFLPNLAEAQVITGRDSPEDCLGDLYDLGPSCVIIKMGALGSAAVTSEGVFSQPACRVLPLETTGAGDCFNAGVILGFLRGWGMPRGLVFASALAGLVVSRRGPDRFPSVGDVEAFAGSQHLSRTRPKV